MKQCFKAATSCCCCCWSWKPEKKENVAVVPRGHLAVYVGEDWKRYVIRVALINHPLFRKLLDQLLLDDEPDHDFQARRLHIPCCDTLFIDILDCAKHDYDYCCRRPSFCCWSSCF
ncbi:unnamed protein product [Linum tenue]|uniref:Uncharacterized protein n=1 Tax=Linum tenue TaxID=586396 RepID=A0AAV0MA06_9ROSI|nr:unnamed protein product [Linum tenue]